MDLFSILVCPVCKGELDRSEDTLQCTACNRVYPIVKGIPILLPDGSVPVTEYQHQLVVRDEYGPWIPRLVMQSLTADQIILEIGAGNMALDLPNVVRMDVTLTPYVDVVCDAHALPFRPDTFSFVFSLAVVEHLRNPFLAAQETFDVLRNGGYTYADCNFVFAYHGYPHHYFNASEQGMEQAFGVFEKLRTGVAPYQMPSFALLMVLETYLDRISPSDDPETQAYKRLLRKVLEQPLKKYDLLFTEQAALNVSAGVFFFGRKALPGESDVVPQVIQHIVEQEPSLKQQFHSLFNLGVKDNVMLWAKEDGRKGYGEIDAYLQNIVPFRKNETVDDEGQKVFDALPIREAPFHTILDPQVGTLVQETSDTRYLYEKTEHLSTLVLQLQLEAMKSAHEAEAALEKATAALGIKNKHIARLERQIKRLESGRVMKLLSAVSRKKK